MYQYILYAGKAEEKKLELCSSLTPIGSKSANQYIQWSIYEIGDFKMLKNDINEM